MKFYNAYIQQLSYDGENYTKGEFRDLLKDFGCGVSSFPFKPYAEAKEAVTREWVDEHGTDVYIPEGGQLMKAYELDVDVIFKGTESAIRTNMMNFLKFIYGHNTGGSARLAIYDEFVGFGRKDVIAKSNDPDVLFISGSDADSVATIKVKFQVCDPMTDVTKVTNVKGECIGLTFSGNIKDIAKA